MWLLNPQSPNVTNIYSCIASDQPTPRKGLTSWRTFESLRTSHWEVVMCEASQAHTIWPFKIRAAAITAISQASSLSAIASQVPVVIWALEALVTEVRWRQWVEWLNYVSNKASYPLKFASVDFAKSPFMVAPLMLAAASYQSLSGETHQVTLRNVPKHGDSISAANMNSVFRRYFFYYIMFTGHIPRTVWSDRKLFLNEPSYPYYHLV